jgi:hypothetical protein
MRKCFSRRYGGPKGAFLVLDIFDMGSSEDAFGIFTHDLDGDPVDFGQGGLYKSGWLRFWRGLFFVSIFDETQTSASQEGARVLAKTVSGLVRDSGPLPRLISGLPSSGLDPRSLRYLHDPVILNTHFYLSDENILHLDSRTEAVLATYRREGAKVTLLLVRYPDAGKAGLAYGSFMKHYLPDADPDGMARLENRRWAGAAFRNGLLGAVLEAEGREPAKGLLREVMESGDKP